MFACIVSDKQYASEKNGYSIPIGWFQELKGDYSFAHEWEYADGIEVNDYQQIICSSCPKRVQRMLDKRRKIITDSMNVFYQLIDSTRHYHSLKSRSTVINMEKNNYIQVKKYGDFTIEGFTKSNDTLNCSLFFRIKDNFIVSWAYFKSGSTTKIYNLKEGKFFVDKSAFDKGNLKANFSFVYFSESEFKPLYWSGKIYSKIKGF